MNVAPAPKPRRVAVARWFDARLVSGVVLVAVAVGVGAHVVSRAEQRVRVLAFIHDLSAGTTIEADDVAFVRVGLPRAQTAVYATGVAAVQGMRLNRTVVRGELVTRALAQRPEKATTLVIPLPAGAAPALRRGDRIVVWAFTNSCSVVKLISDVAVQSVERVDEAITDAGEQRVVVELADDAAATVVKALSAEGVVLRAGIVTGAAQTSAASVWNCQGAAR